MTCQHCGAEPPVRPSIARIPDSAADAEVDFAVAEELSEQAGSRRRQGLLLDARDQLRDALQLYEGIGGTGHASRIRRETSG